MKEQDKLVKLLTWAYVEGFKAASKTLDATVNTLDTKQLENNFHAVLEQKSEGEETKE
jgi:hypothetical protein